MSETPETKLEPVAYRREWDGDDSDLGKFVYVEDASERDHYGLWEPLFSAEHIRYFERQRDQAVKQMEAGWVRVCQSSIGDAVKALAKAEHQRDELADALRESLKHCECECSDLCADIQHGADPAKCRFPCFHCRASAVLQAQS